VYSALADQPGAFLYLQYQRLCKNGVVEIEFLAEEDGYVGIHFRVKNQLTYYLLKIDGQKKLGVTLKKVMNGKHQVLAKDETVGFVKMKWHKI